MITVRRLWAMQSHGHNLLLVAVLFGFQQQIKKQQHGKVEIQ